MKKATKKKTAKMKEGIRLAVVACKGCVEAVLAHTLPAEDVLEDHVFRMSALSCLVADYAVIVANDSGMTHVEIADKFHEYLLRDLAWHADEAVAAD